MNRIYQAFGAIAVVVIGIVFIISFQPQHGQNQVKQGPECAAEVRGECVKGSHFTASLRLLSTRVNEKAIKSMRLREGTMDGLVERQLLLTDAKRLGITVGEDDLTNELRAGRVHVSYPASRLGSAQQSIGLAEAAYVYMDFQDKKTKQPFSYDKYKKSITELSLLSEVEFREYQKLEVTAARVRDLVRSRAQISEAEVKDNFMRRKATATVKYIKLERRYFADNVLDTSEKAIDAWAEDKENKDQVDKVFEGRKPSYSECRVARHILAKVDADPANADAAKKAAKEKIDAAKKRIADGEDFEAVAREVSDDTSAKQGGDLGCVTKGSMVKPFEAALFALPKDGEVSEIVETQFGYHIIELVSIKKGDEALAIGRHNTAKDMYLGQESERLANKGAKELLDAVKAGKSMEDALKDYLASLPKKAKPEKPAKDEKKKDDKKKDGKDAKKEEKKDEKKDKDAKKDEDKKDADKEEEAPPENLPTVETSIPFNESGVPFDGAAPEKDVTSLAFSLKNPGDTPADVIPLEQGTGYAIMQLKERKLASDEDWSKNRDVAIASSRVFKQQDALTTYMKRLLAAAKSEVKPNNEYLLDPADKAKAAQSGSASAPTAPPPQPE